MCKFPYEILQIVFSHLSKIDLLQCQYTNKLWYEASSPLLYANVDLPSKRNSKLYLLTITKSPQLATYLKTIEAGFLFNKKRNKHAAWDDGELMYALLQYCTNITEFVVEDPDHTFWTQLNCAGNQGRLKYLQRLPRPLQRKFDQYMYTAFLFKASLTDLVLFDSKDSTNTFYKVVSEEYKEFISRIKEFPNLQHLEIIQYCRHDLGYFDAIVDDCQKLKSFKINTSFKDWVSDKEILPTTIIKKHHKIQELRCHWSSVNNDDLLKYMMEKYPNLQKIIINLSVWEAPVYPSSVSPDVMTSFLQYVFNISKFEVGFLLNKEDFIDIWLNFAALTGYNGKIEINFNFFDASEGNGVVVNFKKNQTVFYLPPKQLNATHHYVEFLSRVGSLITSLYLNKRQFESYSESESTQEDLLNKEEDIYQILQLCPSLQELRLSIPILKHGLEKRYSYHNKLKSLSVNMYGTNPALEYLQRVFLHAPNLKELHINDVELLDFYAHRIIKIDLPNTQLDLLTLTCKHPDRFFEKYQLSCSIRLNTNSGSSFFIGTAEGLIPTKKKYFDNSSEYLYLIITCRGLKGFSIT
ncbi:hypothetical protein BD770DRAFT_446165 [Pilaira anomala]|nr:hypothetical protein BD770DRAFT_446165 [Pilaira anomala]